MIEVVTKVTFEKKIMVTQHFNPAKKLQKAALSVYSFCFSAVSVLHKTKPHLRICMN